MEKQKKNNKTYLLITLGVLGAIVLTLGLTYAYWRLTREQTGVNVVNTDCFSIDFTGENDITLDKTYPLEDDELESFLSSATPYHFTITNQCSSLASATINLESLNANADKQLDDQWIDAILYETDYHKKLNKSFKLTGNPNNDANKVIKDALHAYSLKSFTLKANEVKDYYLLLYMDQETPLQGDTQNAHWKGKITLSAEYKVDQFANSGTLRTISPSDTRGMWNYKDKLTKIVIETKKSKKEGIDGQTVYGPFNEGDGNTDAIQSYVVCEAEDTNCIGYLQGEGGIKLSSGIYLFYNFTNVTEIDGIENLDTSSITIMNNMFRGMSNLQELDLSGFDTSSVTKMSYMFYGMSNITSLTLGDNFYTSSVIYMDNMFYEMSNLTTLTLGENFDTSSVTNMNHMFSGMSSLQKLDLSNFNTSSVTDMSDMFSGMSNLTKLTLGENFDTSSVIDMSSMFMAMRQIQELDLSRFDTSSVKKMSQMFFGDNSLIKITYGSNFIHNDQATTTNMFMSCPANKPDATVHPSWEGVTF